MPYLDGVRLQTLVANSVQILLQVLVEVLEDEREFLLRVYNIVEPGRERVRNGATGR